MTEETLQTRSAIDLHREDLPMTASETVTVAAGGCLAMWVWLSVAALIAYGLVAVVRWFAGLIF